MGDRANVVVVRENGTHELYRTGWEGPSTELRHRATVFELIRAAWPGWEVRWLYDGPAELREYAGLDPEHVRCPDSDLFAAPFLAPEDEDLAGPDPGGVVITVEGGRCHVASAAFDHPVREGVALLDRLANAPEHKSCALHVNAGIHLDPERRRLGWWSLYSSPQAYQVPELWPGWTVEFWQDDWERHIGAGDRFSPAPFDDGEEARAALLAEARKRWAVRARNRAQPGARCPAEHGSPRRCSEPHG
ncbi:hypothetical protein [Lentzea sp. NPDC003310]|uniref:hypothetical protein n=1 Tax=Lentzea sp. NPDC003310 TaxID=3154447 RepID=UPI0033A9C6C4